MQQETFYLFIGNYEPIEFWNHDLTLNSIIIGGDSAN